MLKTPLVKALPGATTQQRAGMNAKLDDGKAADKPADQFGRPMHDLRISLLDRCNFRCPYCMPVSTFNSDFHFLKKNQLLSYEEILRVVRIAVELGVTKIRLTGGEPLLDKNISRLVEGLTTMPGIADLALTTNGSLLAPVAQRLARAGLKRINISLDSLDPAVFSVMNGGRGDIGRVKQGIDAAEEAGISPIKINVVVQRSVNAHTVLDLLEYFRGTGHIVRLIEYMDVGNRNGWRMEEVVPTIELLNMVNARWPVVPVNPNYRGEVARRYKYIDGAGEIGFVSSVSAPFCGSCSRARLSADGVLYTCLFAATGTDIRKLLRSGANDVEIHKTMTAVWLARTDRYSELRQRNNGETRKLRKVEMYRVGG